MKKLYILVLLLLSGVLLFAGNGDGEKFSASKTTKAAEKALKEGNLYGAVELYQDVLDHDEANKDVAYKLGQLYFQIRDYKSAEKCFGIAKQGNQFSSNDLALYYYALMLKYNGKYNDALKAFEEVKQKKPIADNFNIKWVDVDIAGCKLALNPTTKKTTATVTHLGSEINSAYSDFAPTLWDNDAILFSSLPSDTIIIKNKDNYLVKFYKADKNGNTYNKVSSMPEFDVAGKHTANGTLSADKNSFYFSVCSEDKTGAVNCKLFLSKRNSSGWSEPKEIEGINMNDYTTTQPTIGVYQGNREILYFASNRPGGKGGMDIWYATLNRSGEYSTPKNAGKRINTDRDELTPFYDLSSNSLYFSSNGFPNLGGYDVFVAEGSRGQWTEPVNLEAPVNSSTDDMYYSTFDGGKKALMVSNRPGIISVKSETCCDDIFSVEYKNVFVLAVTGNVYNRESKEVVDDAKVLLLMKDPESGQDILVNEDVSTKERKYFFNLRKDREYKLTALKEGYLTASENFSTLNKNESDTLLVDLFLNKIDKNKAYRLNNIYYDFDKWNLRDDSKKTLDSLYQILIENPQIIIELGSHTDSRGTDEYNQSLSQKRAQSCVDYLISKGIDTKRLQAKGYGEAKPLDDCSKYEECPQTAQGDCPCHQLNRRTEFRIVGELDGVLRYDGPRYDDEN